MGAGVEGHGLTEREQAIMDRHEAGVSVAMICAELGLKRSYVEKRIREYTPSIASQVAFERMARRGCEAMEAAIARTGTRYA